MQDSRGPKCTAWHKAQLALQGALRAVSHLDRGNVHSRGLECGCAWPVRQLRHAGHLQQGAAVGQLHHVQLLQPENEPAPPCLSVDSGLRLQDSGCCSLRADSCQPVTSHAQHGYLTCTWGQDTRYWDCVKELTRAGAVRPRQHAWHHPLSLYLDFAARLCALVRALNWGEQAHVTCTGVLGMLAHRTQRP